MKTTNKLTITLSPEEVKAAVERYIYSTFGAVVQDGDLKVTLDVSNVLRGNGTHEYSETIFTGATVEVTQP